MPKAASLTKPDKKPVSVEHFGKDHWSTFAYLDCRATDNKGTIDREHMRCDQDLHPGLRNSANRNSAKGDRKYPTILRGGIQLENHDDWSCFEDLEAAGFVKWEGTGFNPIVVFTELGNKIAGKLRAHKKSGGSFSTFEPDSAGVQVEDGLKPLCPQEY